MNQLSCCTKRLLRSISIPSCRILAIRQNSSAQHWKTNYETLGVPSTASEKEIKAAYIELCKKYHPDANPNDPQAQQKFVELQKAYEILSEEKTLKDLPAGVTMDEIIKECRQQVTAEKLKARKEREEREQDIEYTPNHGINLWIGPIIFFAGIIILEGRP
eukprot:XP_011426534.1 PREDICTED: uncharacterized protein LOC105327642 isoform X3 [Crassostrea gigas]